MLKLEQLADKAMNDAITDLTVLGINVTPASQYNVMKTRLAGLADRDDLQAMRLGLALMMAMKRLEQHVPLIHL